VRAFYRHTGIRLKQLGIGYLRTDHAGKDRTRGQRGSSAKRDDVDIVWSLRRTQAGVSLNCKNSSRLSWVPTDLKLDRLVDPNGIVSYRTPVVFASTPAGAGTRSSQPPSPTAVRGRIQRGQPRGQLRGTVSRDSPRDRTPIALPICSLTRTFLLGTAPGDSPGTAHESNCPPTPHHRWGWGRDRPRT